MTYMQLKQKHQEEVNAFPFGFAFGDKQFKEMMSKWGLDADNDEDLKKIVSIGAGGYLRKTDVPAFEEMCERHNKEIQAFKKDEKEFIAGIVYELHNHEYGYSRDEADVEAALRSFNLDLEDVQKDEHLREMVQKAIKQCVKEYNEMEDDNEDY